MNTAILNYCRLRYLIVFAVACSGYSSVHAVPVLWSGNDHLYEVISSDGILWDTARTDALALGAGWNLASITSQAEQDFIVSLLPVSASERDHSWIGGTDATTEGNWEWVDGEAWVDGVSYENWYSGEPNNLNEDFLAMDFRGGAWGGWNDASDVTAAGLVRGYIVEFSGAVPEPTTLALLAVGLTGLVVARQRPDKRFGKQTLT